MTGPSRLTVRESRATNRQIARGGSSVAWGVWERYAQLCRDAASLRLSVSATMRLQDEQQVAYDAGYYPFGSRTR